MCKYIMCLFNHYPHQKGYANHNYCVCLQLEFGNIGGSNKLLADFNLYKDQN